MERSKPKVLRDILWAWGNPEMGEPGSHTVATFAQAPSAERAQLLGVPNVVMAGHGLPDDEKQADAWTREVLGSPRLIWEIMADGEGGPPFVYEKRIALVRKLIGKYPQIEGILLDDMSTVKVRKGFKAEHIREIRRLWWAPIRPAPNRGEGQGGWVVRGGRVGRYALSRGRREGRVPEKGSK